MKKSFKRAVAVSAVCAAGLAGTLTTTPAATAQDDAPAPKVLTDFGMTALAYGTKISLGGIDVKSLKDAKTLQACTRTTGLERLAPSLLSTDTIAELLGDALPVNLAGLIHLSPSTSSTETYRDGNITGVRATNLLGDIVVGAEELVPGVQLPTLEIKGLEAVADSFHDPADRDGDGNEYGTAESFGFKSLKLILPEDGVIGDTLNLLLENLGLGTDVLNEIINVPLGILVDTLNQLIEMADPVLGDVIEIPGLGSIGLGSSFTKVGEGFASSGANALQIEVDPTESNNDSAALLKLGYAQSRIDEGAVNGVFRSTLSGLNLKALPLTEDTELLHLGGIGTQAIPCAGTDGTTESKTVESVSFPLSLPGLPVSLATLNGIEYSYSAKQLSRGRARSVATSSLGSLEIPVLDLVISGVESTLKLRSTGKQGKAVRGNNKPQFKLASVLYKGEELLPPGGLGIGETVSFVVEQLNNTNGFITFGPRATSNFYGGKLSATQLKIGDLLTLDLGWLESQIFPR
ncbi:hypothetical protein [Nocardioides sp.]|uniref:hypothetical protein n=1 Tax=Nocardioides sp. TaxID=35761 RepID=UPI002631E747|nr:hypothetical protein [Nocardioides sp.]